MLQIFNEMQGEIIPDSEQCDTVVQLGLH